MTARTREIAQQVVVRVSTMKCLTGKQTEVLHAHEGRIVHIEDEASRTDFILGNSNGKFLFKKLTVCARVTDSHQRRSKSRRSVRCRWRLHCRFTRWTLKPVRRLSESLATEWARTTATACS